MKERIRITSHPRKEVDIEKLAHALLEHLRNQAALQTDADSASDEVAS